LKEHLLLVAIKNSYHIYHIRPSAEIHGCHRSLYRQDNRPQTEAGADHAFGSDGVHPQGARASWSAD
jgi:hypothetical protein